MCRFTAIHESSNTVFFFILVSCNVSMGIGIFRCSMCLCTPKSRRVEYSWFFVVFRSTSESGMERKTVKPTAQIYRDLRSSEGRYSTENILIHTDLWRNHCGSFALGLNGVMRKILHTHIYHVCI